MRFPYRYRKGICARGICADLPPRRFLTKEEMLNQVLIWTTLTVTHNQGKILPMETTGTIGIPMFFYVLKKS